MKRWTLFALALFGMGTTLTFPSIVAAPAKKTSNTHTRKAQLAPKAAAPDPEEATPGTSPYTLSTLPLTAAKQALLIDVESGATLYEKNADQLMSPSSMTKIATACFVANKLQTGEVTWDTTFTVSKNAYRLEGSTAFLNIGQKVTVRDLLETLIIVSANDSAVTLAEGLCGTEGIFAEALTTFVRSLGATHTTFTNASGLPDPRHKTTARDLALISLYALKDAPDIYPLYKETSLTFNNITQPNKNTLLRKNIGCDGIKTGHTNDGGFGIVASCVQDGRRLLLVVNGYGSEQTRANDACALLTWGAKMFENRALFKAGQTIARVPVWYGSENYVPVTVAQNVALTLPKGMSHNVTISLNVTTPVQGSVEKGTPVGEICITGDPLSEPVTVPLLAQKSISKAGFMKKVQDALFYLFVGFKKPEFLFQEGA